MGWGAVWGDSSVHIPYMFRREKVLKVLKSSKCKHATTGILQYPSEIEVTV